MVVACMPASAGAPLWLSVSPLCVFCDPECLPCPKPLTRQCTGLATHSRLQAAPAPSAGVR